MDVSDIWWYLALAVFVAGLIFCVRKLIKDRWVRDLVATITLIVTGTLVLLAFAITAACTKRAPLMYSPDQRHIALLNYAFQGALGDDYANVDVRSRWSLFPRNAYRGLGYWDFKNGKPLYPEVRWLDNTHLSIRFWDDRTGKEGRGAPATCVSRVGDIQVVCEHLWPPLPLRP
jgi:hypothetical protein